MGRHPPTYHAARDWFLHRKTRGAAYSTGQCVGSAPELTVVTPLQEPQHQVESFHDSSMMILRAADDRQHALRVCSAQPALAPPTDVPPRRELRLHPAGDSAKLQIADEALKSILVVHSMILNQGYASTVRFLGQGTFGVVLGLVKDGRVTVAIKIGKQGGTFHDIVSGDFGREAAAMMVSSASRVPFALLQLFGESGVAAVPTLFSDLESEAPGQGPKYIAVAAMSAGSCTGHAHLEYVNSSFKNKNGQVTTEGWAKCRGFYKSLLEATSSAHASGMAVRDMNPSNWILKEIVASESGQCPGRDALVKTKDGILCAVLFN